MLLVGQNHDKNRQRILLNILHIEEVDVLRKFIWQTYKFSLKSVSVTVQK